MKKFLEPIFNTIGYTLLFFMVVGSCGFLLFDFYTCFYPEYYRVDCSPDPFRYFFRGLFKGFFQALGDGNGKGLGECLLGVIGMIGAGIAAAVRAVYQFFRRIWDPSAVIQKGEPISSPLPITSHWEKTVRFTPDPAFRKQPPPSHAPFSPPNPPTTKQLTGRWYGPLYFAAGHGEWQFLPNNKVRWFGGMPLEQLLTTVYQLDKQGVLQFTFNKRIFLFFVRLTDNNQLELKTSEGEKILLQKI
jgi:hypothetical protein